jgi:4'-phosphopantetheinyl transferase
MDAAGKVFFCILPRDITSKDISLLTEGLPDFRREKALRYKRKEDMALSAAVWRLLCYAVKSTYGLDAFMLDLSFDGKGKPAFKQETGIHFSLSHCKSAVACALDGYPCGVDAEPLRKADTAVMRRVMPSIADKLSALSGTEADDWFTRSWTEYESVFKAGAGYFPDIERGYTLANFKHMGYYVAFCFKERKLGAEFNVINFDQILET